MLETRSFGLTDMEITRVGVGAWAMGGGGWSFGWGDQDDRESIDAIRHALDSGVNWIDTAAAYGMGNSEEVIGRALEGMPEADRPYVFTKCGLIVPDDPYADPEPVGDPATLRRECEDSLRRLRVERLDLFQVHWPAKDGTPVEEYWGVLLELKAEGKIRAAGLSNHQVDQLDEAESVGHVDTVQPPFSAIDRGAAADVLPWAQQHGAGVIVYSPMQSGLLTGSFSRERFEALHPEDWRRSDEHFTTHLDENLAVADALRGIADRHGTTVAAVAVAWTLAWPGVTGAIVGARRPAQVDGWLPAAQLRLDDADLNEVAAVVQTTGAGSGPIEPPTVAALS
jgi:aryl-alcohol dehydrogenase-like predicted oxidoreductase